MTRQRFAMRLAMVVAVLLTGCHVPTDRAVHPEPLGVVPTLPAVPDRAVSVRDFGAVGDGVADDTAAFTASVARLVADGGGRLVVPPGRYLTGPFALASRTDLHLEAGATILARNDIANYPTGPAQYFNNSVRYTDLITADRCHDVSITGTGTIDGQGAPWWDKYRKHKGPGPQPGDLYPHRPNLVVFSGCDRVLVQGVRLMNSAEFHLVPQICRDVTIDGVTITAPADSPNTDGIDPSGQRFRIVSCDISVGDDNIAIKPSLPPTWTPRPDDAGHASCEDFYIAHCTFRRGHGLSIGGQTTDGLKRLIVDDCTFIDTNVGVRMKSQQGTGGLVEDCYYRNLKMQNVKVAVLITSYYPAIPKDPATMPATADDDRTPTWKHIRIENVSAVGCTEAGGVIGLKNRPVNGVGFKNVKIEAQRPMRIVDARGVRLISTKIRLPDGSPGVVATRAKIKGNTAVGPWTGAVAPIERTGNPAGMEDAPETQATTRP